MRWNLTMVAVFVAGGLCSHVVSVGLAGSDDQVTAADEPVAGEASLVLDETATAASAVAPCPSDLDDNGSVDVLDLLVLLGDWGDCLGGACCLTDNTCIEMTESMCDSSGGAYQGDSTTCEVQFCGVCCYQGKNKDSCTSDLTIPSVCEASGGYFLGECTYCGGFCDFVDWGACCLPDGSCIQASVFTCKGLNGDFTGGLSCDCAGCVPDPTGACCTLSLTCSVVTEFECFMMDGVYDGDGTTCSGVPGACCIFDDCIDGTDESCCTSQGGTFLGAGSDCSGGCP